jgi:hypothetical protein
MHVRLVRIMRVVLLVLTMAWVQLVAIVGSVAVSGGDYDAFDGVTLNDVNGAGDEIAYSGGIRQFDSLVFDTSTFTLQPGENESGGSLNACATPAPTGVHAGRTGWLRFNPGANGRIDVLAETPGYDSVLMVRSATEVPWRTATFSQLEGLDACANKTAAPGDEVVTGFPVAADRVYYVQVGGVCAGGPATCEDVSTPGGPTHIRVTFRPFDTDADGVPDSLDNCEGEGAQGRVTSDGCPDADADGIRDAADDCPQVAGVPAPAPYSGCPAGPVPPDPANTPYVVIESLTGDAYSTPRRKVRLRLNWPKGTVSALISNPSARTKTRTVADVVTWRLRAAKHPANRGVRVRFRGPHVPDVIVGDSIELDPTPPEVPVAVLLASGEGWYIGVHAEDRGTGVSAVAVLDEGRQPIEDEQVCTLDQCEDDVDIAFSTLFRLPAFIQVTDPSGNVSVEPLEKATAASTNCADSLVPYRSPPSHLACVRVTQRCGVLKPLLRWWVSPEVRCRRLDGETYRVVRR